MRPRSTVQSVILYTQQTNDGDYIPRRVEVNSWVALYPGKRGGHARDSMKYGVTTIAGAYKAKVLEFHIAPGSGKVKAVKVMHAYMHRQLQLQPDVVATLDGACNCKIFLLSKLRFLFNKFVTKLGIAQLFILHSTSFFVEFWNAIVKFLSPICQL